MDAHETDHIWLRQTITFTVDGQTRTLEMGIPVPRDATPRDVEALLEVADAGMSALSRRLDAHIAEALTGDTPPHTPALAHTHAEEGAPALPMAAEPQPQPQPQPQAQAQAPVAANGHTPDETTRPPATEPHEPREPREPQAATAPAIPERPASTPTPPAQRPTPQPPRAQPPTAPAPAAPTPPATTAVTAARPAPAARDTHSPTGAEMTRPEFLAAAAELGLNPRQAMDRLGVRSLEGLNLREALESLRRQLLGAASQPEPEADPKPEPDPPSSATLSPSPASPRYFDEEDDETLVFSLDEDDGFPGDDNVPEDDALMAGGDARLAAVSDAEADDALDEDELDLDDVPDLSPPPPAPTTTRQRTPSTARKAPTAIREASGPAPEQASNGARTQAMQLVGKLRAATGGGPASEYQRNAYHNIVEDELGKTQATALVRGLWRTTADRLTAGQLDALIRWGKEDVFAEEAAQVLATLRAEQRRAEQPGTAAQRTATRGRPGEGAR